ncbi:hypothetical protein AKJ53_01120 [candidate division MSBL1 archaeon SCGC-AAA382F02]|uniref:Right handed beta helix domain-containing protein n=1 Tax=candidate division MSBL1 archaeon SCGC-AAA382F02 TaxID=1698282 RepID=A0A133VIA6_9EURY|nr:hypothetical protein AKJ53_01120 [candidate division MSBL1 archaeon SCGC-AAA382F02]
MRVASASPPAQHGPPTQKDTGNVTHVTAGESIQEAIDDVPDGSTIFVHEGTYKEFLIIQGKDLKLIAVGDVILKNPDVEESLSKKKGMIVISESECTIDGFTVDVDGGWEGIYAYGGPYYGTGEVEVTVKNNKVTEYERNGITVNGEKASGSIMNNMVVGQEDSWWANNGIQIGFGATGMIKGNTVKKNVWIGEGWTATAILIYDVSDVQMVKNTVEEGQLGIGVLGNNNKIVNNYLEDGTWSIGVYSGTNNKVIRNTIVDYNYGVSDYGEETKVHANR